MFFNGCGKKESDIYKEYKYPNEKFFGKEIYSEIDYKCNEEEEKIGKEIVEIAKSVFTFVGDEKDANMDVGNLKKYYWFKDSGVSIVNCSIEHITTKIIDNKGHIWVTYSIFRYDNQRKLINKSDNILACWEICLDKETEKWEVVDIREAP